MTKPCHSCRSNQMNEKETVFSNGTKHIALFCCKCGAMNGYKPQHNYSGNQIMPFGKHKGKKLSELPEDYLGWCIENLETNFRHKITAEILRRGLKTTGWEKYVKEFEEYKKQ